MQIAELLGCCWVLEGPRVSPGSCVIEPVNCFGWLRLPVEKSRARSNRLQERKKSHVQAKVKSQTQCVSIGHSRCTPVLQIHQCIENLMKYVNNNIH